MSGRYALNKNKYLLSPELEALNQVLEKFSKQCPRDTTILRLALKTGARATELLNITRADFNFYDGTLFIKGIKGSNDREIPLNENLLEASAAWAQSFEPQKKIFAIGYHRLRQIWDQYRPVNKKFHCLRHTFAIELYQKTKDIRLVQFALGHRNITNTMIYADYVYSTTELKKLMLSK